MNSQILLNQTRNQRPQVCSANSLNHPHCPECVEDDWVATIPNPHTTNPPSKSHPSNELGDIGCSEYDSHPIINFIMMHRKGDLIPQV